MWIRLPFCFVSQLKGCVAKDWALSLDVEWDESGITAAAQPKYLREFADRVCGTLARAILDAAAARPKRPHPLVAEVREHLGRAQASARTLIGRDEELKVCEMPLFTPPLELAAGLTLLHHPRVTLLSFLLHQFIADFLRLNQSKPLVLVGAHGSGKSALLARALFNAAKTSPTAIIVYRQIAASVGSCGVHSLLSGVVAQLEHLQGLKLSDKPATIPRLMEVLKLNLARVTQKNPLYLLIDSLVSPPRSVS